MSEMRAKLGLDNAQFNTGLKQAEISLGNFSRAINNPSQSIKGLLSNLPVFGAIAGVAYAAYGVIKSIGEGIKTAFDLSIQRQQLIAQFSAFYGSVDAAKSKLREFTEYSNHTQFSTADVALTAQKLDVLSDGALKGKATLKMIGDTASATGRDFVEVGTQVGVLYAKLSSGDSIARPLLAMQKMGAIAPDVAEKIKDMAAAGEPMEKIWPLIEGQMNRFQGTTEAMADTFQGSETRMEKAWNSILRELGTPIVDTITPWAKSSADSLQSLKNHLYEVDNYWKLLTVAASTVWMVWITGIGVAVRTVEAFIDAVSGLNNIVAVGLAANFKAAWEAIKGNFSGAIDILKSSSDQAVQIVKDTAAKVKGEYKGMNAEIAGNIVTWAHSIADTAPTVPTVTPPADPDAEELKEDNEEINSKQAELDELQRKNSEDHLSDLERINILTVTRVAMLREALALERDAHDLAKNKQDIGASKKAEAQALTKRIEAAHIESELGGVSSAREERITTLKQQLLDHQEAAMPKAAEIAALELEKSNLDLNNVDEEVRLKAQNRSAEIDDKLKELRERHGHGVTIDSSRRMGLGGFKGVNYDMLLGGMDEPKKQTGLQAKMERHLSKLASHVGGTSSIAPMGRFGR